ncbi:MAG: hypothetical protein BRD43_06160 [Bacteroidetes bacterium QS_4_64_154]|nr:MAG: hypothetical protein BRD43_06160 [Bacteroidetes bacterium QS_4_64_154]
MPVSRNAFTYVCIAGVLLAFGAACEMIGSAESPDADRPLVGPVWQLVAFEAADGSRTSVDSKYDRPRDDSLLPYYGLRFTETPVPDCGTDKVEETQCMETKARGYPNQGFFSYKMEDDQEMRIYFNGTTLMGTFPDSKEGKFFSALAAVTGYTIDGSRLRLTYGNSKTLLFEARSTGESWGARGELRFFCPPERISIACGPNASRGRGA